MKWLIFISILLYGCGSENHGYGWTYDYKFNGLRVRGETTLTPDEIYTEYEKAVQCFGDKPPPFIIFTDGLPDRCGQTKYNPPLILINKFCMTYQRTIKHELVHYFGTHGHKQDFKTAVQCIKQPYNSL